MDAEWIKFRTLRSSWYTLLAAVVLLVAAGAIIGYTTSTANWATLSADRKAASSAIDGYHLAELFIGVLGVLFVTGEYATGMIRSTFAAVPRRLPVVGAKSVVFGAIALTTMTLASFAAFFAAQAFLSSHGHGSSLADPGVLRSVAGVGVYMALIGLFGMALGWIVRSTAGGISVLVGILMVIPPVIGLLSSSVSDAVTKFLPGEAGGAFLTTLHAPHTLMPWPGLGVLTLWVAAALAVAAVRVRRLDA
jgi:hypothetical protein